MGSADSIAQSIAADLKGQIMHVPNFYGMFASWPAKEVNPYYAKMKVFIDGVIDAYVCDFLL